MPKLTPRNTDFVDTAPIRITTVVTAKATPEEVWAVMADNERWPEWFNAAKSCRTTSDVSGGVGSTRWIHVDLFK
ncbi:MAG: SRPBCC family protein, partial [Polyangiales bacterium]